MPQCTPMLPAVGFGCLQLGSPGFNSSPVVGGAGPPVRAGSGLADVGHRRENTTRTARQHVNLHSRLPSLQARLHATRRRCSCGAAVHTTGCCDDSHTSIIYSALHPSSHPPRSLFARRAARRRCVRAQRVPQRHRPHGRCKQAEETRHRRACAARGATIPFPAHGDVHSASQPVPLMIGAAVDSPRARDHYGGGPLLAAQTP
jgi:hypothetical protein